MDRREEIEKILETKLNVYINIPSEKKDGEILSCRYNQKEIVDELLTLIRKAEDEAIERCAKVADDEDYCMDCSTNESIAQAIRQLKSERGE